MNQGIIKTEIANMFAQAAKYLRLEHQNLTELDSVAEDGDHGGTMLRVAEQLDHAFDQANAKSLQMLLRDAGVSILGVVGGASSATLSVFFSGMADAEIGDDSMHCHELAEAASAARGGAEATKGHDCTGRSEPAIGRENKGIIFTDSYVGSVRLTLKKHSE